MKEKIFLNIIGFLVIMLLFFMSTCSDDDDDETVTPIEPGLLYSVDHIVGNMRTVPATDSEGFIQGSPTTEKCRNDNETQFRHRLTRNILVMETEVSRQMWIELQQHQSSLPDDPSDR